MMIMEETEFSEHVFFGKREDLEHFKKQLQEWYLVGFKALQHLKIKPRSGWLGYVAIGADLNPIVGWINKATDDSPIKHEMPLDCENYFEPNQMENCFTNQDTFNIINPFNEYSKANNYAASIITMSGIDYYLIGGEHPFKVWQRLIDKSGIDIKHTAIYGIEDEHYFIFDPDYTHYYDSQYQYALNFDFSDSESEALEEIKNRFDDDQYPAPNEEFGEYWLSEKQMIHWLQRLLLTKETDIEKLKSLADEFDGSSDNHDQLANNVCPDGFDGWVDVIPIQYITEV